MSLLCSGHRNLVQNKPRILSRLQIWIVYGVLVSIHFDGERRRRVRETTEPAAVVPEVAHPSFRSEQLACRPASLWPSHLEHDGLERQARRSAKFANERFAQSVDDMIRIDSAAGANHVDQWITVDQRTRKGADIRDFLVPGQHGNPQIDEAGIAHRRLNRIDFVVAGTHPIKLRRIGREKLGGYFVSDAT